MEIRYIVFTADEMRNAVVGFVLKQGQLATPGDVAAVELVGPSETPSAIIKLQPSLAKKPINLGAQYLVAALLLYCMDRRIPLPKQAEKRVELSVNGLTLVVTTDASSGSPHLAANQVSYGDMANRATRTIGTIPGGTGACHCARGLRREFDQPGRRKGSEGRGGSGEIVCGPDRRRIGAGCAWTARPLVGQTKVANLRRFGLKQ